jgi:hypothetical protein
MKHLSLPFIAQESQVDASSSSSVRSQVHGVAFPEQQRLKKWPDLFVAPMFAEDVGWVVSATDVVELGDTCGNAFADAVEGKCCVAFVIHCHRTSWCSP